MNHNLSPFNAIIAASTALDPTSRPDLTQVRGRLTLTDGSVLHVRENYVVITGWIDYAYQWQTADHQLIIRWDNAHAVDLPTSPYHQHVGSEDNVLPSEPMTLEMVLAFIATQLISG
jgi:hypothetical protein